ncbi:MAG: GNAT family N-acetyltransferase [Verrucomicrobiota bacterium]|nr:GNAT family N-acetyltransferase [Verrucomicrobiota bacterium]
MKVVCKTERCLDALLEEKGMLEDLEKRSIWKNPYFSPEWLEAWLKRQPDGVKPVLLIARTDTGSLEGFWPFVERPGLLGSKGLWPFVYDEANYFDPWSSELAVHGLVEGLRNLMKEFTFSWIPLARNAFWEKVLEPESLKCKLPSISRVPRKTSLLSPESGMSFDEFWSLGMGPKSRKSFRYDSRRLEEKGDVRIECLETFEEVRSVMPTTCMVEVESWKSSEGAGLYSIRGKRGFFFELLPELAKEGRARIHVLRVNDEPIAWELDLLSQGFMGVHHLSFHQEWKKYSPGKQLLRHSLRKSWEEGRTIDFLPCNLDYKEKLSTTVEPVREFHWFRRSLRGALARRLILWNMKARKKIRQASKRTKSSQNFWRAVES